MIIELTKDIKVFRPQAKSMFPYCNTMFIDDDIKVIIDPGAGGRAYQSIDYETIDIVLLSHYHFDHVHGVSFFKNARILAADEEKEAYEDKESYLHFLGYSRWEELMGKPNRVGTYASKSKMPDDIPVRPGSQDIKLTAVFKDGDVMVSGRNKIISVHTPGHSRGHYAFYIEKEGIMFSGDIDISPRGPWYGGEYADIDQYISSIKRIIEIKPMILVSAHRRVFYDNIAPLLDIFMGKIIKKEESILNYLNQPRTLNDIASQDFTHDFPQVNEHLIFWTKMMIVKHLQRLIKFGLIEEIEEKLYMRR